MDEPNNAKLSQVVKERWDMQNARAQVEKTSGRGAKCKREWGCLLELEAPNACNRTTNNPKELKFTLTV